MTKNIRTKKSPGGRLLTHKIKFRSPKAHCKICGTLLNNRMQKKTKSGKRVTRPYSSEICHECLKTSIQVSNHQPITS